MKKVNEVIVKENIIETLEVSKNNSILDNLEVGKVEEVFTYSTNGYINLAGVSSEGKCGAEDQEGTNYSVEISTYNPINFNPNEIYNISNRLGSSEDGMYWKGSCEEIANFLVLEINKIFASNLAEVIVNVSPNEFTTVTTHWQDHMNLPSIKNSAKPKFKNLPKPQTRYVGCGR